MTLSRMKNVYTPLSCSLFIATRICSFPKNVKETDKNKANNKITQKIIISGFLS